MYILLFSAMPHFFCHASLSDTITSHPFRLSTPSNLHFYFVMDCLRTSWCKAHAFHKAHYVIHRVFDVHT